jgi:hypothetical protein
VRRQERRRRANGRRWRLMHPFERSREESPRLLRAPAGVDKGKGGK